MHFENSTDVIGENGQDSVKWGQERDICVVSGTNFGACVPKDHPYKTDEDSYSVIARYACGKKKNFSQYQREHFLNPGKTGEKIALPRFCQENKCKLYRPGLLVCNHQPLWRGSPDGINVEEKYIWECKTLTSRNFEFDENGNAKVQKKNMGQCQFYMYLTGYKRCALTQYKKKTGETHTTWIDYDEENTLVALMHAERVTRIAVRTRECIEKHVRDIHEHIDAMVLPERDAKYKDEDEMWLTPVDRLEAHSVCILAALDEINSIYENYAPNPKPREKSTERRVSQLEKLETSMFAYAPLEVDDALVNELLAAKKK